MIGATRMVLYRGSLSVMMTRPLLNLANEIIKIVSFKTFAADSEVFHPPFMRLLPCLPPFHFSFLLAWLLS